MTSMINLQTMTETVYLISSEDQRVSRVYRAYRAGPGHEVSLDREASQG